MTNDTKKILLKQKRVQNKQNLTMFLSFIILSVAFLLPVVISL